MYCAVTDGGTDEIPPLLGYLVVRREREARGVAALEQLVLEPADHPRKRLAMYMTRRVTVALLQYSTAQRSCIALALHLHCAFTLH